MPDDEIVFQDEHYDGFFGDGGGVVVARLAHPLEYETDSWTSINNLPDEFKSVLKYRVMGDEYLQSVLQDDEAIWCLSKLQRNGEHISNIVLFFYRPSNRTVIEWILHT